MFSAISLFNSNFFQSIKGLILDILCGSFLILSRFNANVVAY